MTFSLVGRCWGLDIDPIPMIVLMALCDSADDDGSNCFPSPARIKWKTNLSKSAIYDTLHDLEEREIIQQVGMRGDYPEYQILLENAPRKPPFDKPRMGRPRKIPPPEKSSATRKTFPVAENIPPGGKVVRHAENIPPGGKVVRHAEKSSATRKSIPPHGRLSGVSVATADRPHQAPHNASVTPTRSLLDHYPVNDSARIPSIEKKKEPEPEPRPQRDDWPPAERQDRDWPPSPALPTREDDIWPPPEDNNWPVMWKWARTGFGRQMLCELGYSAETRRNMEIAVAYRQWYQRRELLARIPAANMAG